MNRLQPNTHSGFDLFLDIIGNVTHIDNFSNFQSFLKNAARQLTSSDSASIILRQGEDCFYIDEDSDQPLWKGMSFPLSTCVSGWCILNAETVSVENIFKDKRVPVALYQDKNIQSLLVVPIKNSNVIGAISVYWNEIHSPSRSEIMQLEALANVSSLVFELMKSHSELEEVISLRTAELETANQRLADMAVRDELTNLYNRRGFFLMAEQTIKASYRTKMGCFLMFADIDGLKPINDLHGHHAGDKVIKIVADLLSNHFRKTDIVARMGGDEFTVLVIDPDENVELMNHRLQSYFSAFNLTSNLPYQINISFGSIVSELNPTTQLEMLINQADKLMYMEKSRKKH